METFIQAIIVILGAIALLFLMCCFLGVFTWLLWNWLMPIIFGLPQITLFQAIGLNFLSGILFKNSSASKTSK